MALSQIQQRIERSVFEALRQVAVEEGYLPDLTDTGLFGSAPYTAANEAAWTAALVSIVNAKGFAIEIFGHSVTKGIKAVPRIVFISRRTMPGEIGAPQAPFYDKANSGALQLPLEASNFFFDIHAVSGSAAQDRVLNAIISKALGQKKYIDWYDDEDSEDKLFIKNVSYFDIPDPIEGQEEKVYSYEAPDIFDVVEDYISVATITEIFMQLTSNKDPDDEVEDGGVTVTPTTREFT
jgi:hypothetical protein